MTEDSYADCEDMQNPYHAYPHGKNAVRLPDDQSDAHTDHAMPTYTHDCAWFVAWENACRRLVDARTEWDDARLDSEIRFRERKLTEQGYFAAQVVFDALNRAHGRVPTLHKECARLSSLTNENVAALYRDAAKKSVEIQNPEAPKNLSRLVPPRKGAVKPATPPEILHRNRLLNLVSGITDELKPLYRKYASLLEDQKERERLIRAIQHPTAVADPIVTHHIVVSYHKEKV